MGQSQARESVESGDEDTDVCGPESISYLPKPNALQVQFLEYVANGNVDQLTEFVKKHEMTPTLYADCTNHRGQTALEIAAAREDTPMVKCLMRLGVGRKSVDCSLIRASQFDNVGLVKLLLDAPVIDQKAETSASSDTNDERKCCADYTCDLGPLHMAAQYDHYDIVNLLLSRGHTIAKPHPASCTCDLCFYQSRTQKGQSLHQSIVRMNAYRAITSASYISQTSDDPILTAFQLHGELKEWASHEPEFKDEYERLADMCSKFAVALIGHCRTTDEVKRIINKRTLQEKIMKNGPKDEMFSRIALALKYDIKEFVTHSNCQEVMRCEWRKHWEGTGSVDWKDMIQMFLLRLLLMPFFAVIYWVAPQSTLARSWNSPLTKYISAMAVYIDFIVVLLIQNHLDAINGNRGPPRTGFEVYIILFVVGKWWKNISTLWIYGYEIFFLSSMVGLYTRDCRWAWPFRAGLLWIYSHGNRQEANSIHLPAVKTMYSRQGWNLYDNAMLTFFSLTFVCWGLSAVDVARFGKADLSRALWSPYDPRLMGEAFYSVACVMAIIKLTFFMQITSYFGPLQVSISRLLGDLASFLCMMLLFVVAFATGLWILYRGYAGFVRHTATNVTVEQVSVYSYLPQAMATLYWSLYGLEDLHNNNVVVPEFTVPIGNDTLTVYNEHRPTELIGYTMYGFASFCCIVIMLNMLIAVMTSSLSAVQEKADMEWKYARTKVWMNYFVAGDVMPSPFNLIPDVYSLTILIRWCAERLNLASGLKGKGRHRPKARCNIYQCCYFDRDDRCSIRQEERAYQQASISLSKWRRESTECF